MMRKLAMLAAVMLPMAVSTAHAQQSPNLATAVFAGGCFWCTESDFDKVPGVVKTISGYIGGKLENPKYEQVGRGNTGHTEAVEVTFDTTKVSYERLVEYFWRTIDPLDGEGQFCDRGPEYRPEIFAADEMQRKAAEASRQKLIESKRFSSPIAVKVTTGQKFWPAEDYHQDFYTKSPLRYFTYRAGCGRDSRVKGLWGDEAGGKKLLTN